MNSCRCRKHAYDPDCIKHGFVTEEQFRELSEQTTIVAQVMEDLRQREAYGMEQYGVPLLEDGNKDDALQEAYEEALDLCIYLKLELVRRDNG